MRRRWQDLGAVVEASPEERLDEDLEHLDRAAPCALGIAAGGRRTSIPPAGGCSPKSDASLLPEDRFRLFTVRVGSDVAAAELFVVAGGVLGAWGGGFDERWQNLSPSIVAVAAAVEDACVRGERCLDLGEGAEPYKIRFGEAVSPVVWTRLYPRTRRYPLTRARAVPSELRHAVRRRLSPTRRAQVKRLVARVRQHRAKRRTEKR